MFAGAEYALPILAICQSFSAACIVQSFISMVYDLLAFHLRHTVMQ